MLRFLLGPCNPRVQDAESFPECQGSDRKLRLFACACYHDVCGLMPDPLARASVITAEAFADGELGEERLRGAEAELFGRITAIEEQWRASRGRERAALLPTYAAWALAYQVVRAEAPKAAYYASSNAYLHAAEILNPGAAHHDRAFGRGQAAVEQRQADALRDIFGPTLFRAIGLDSRWLTSTVLDLAKFIYREKSFGRLPILADVLMEAGCDDETLLGHCQGGRPHVRGCWLVDLILGKC
jgi:hypothetical protein